MSYGIYKNGIKIKKIEGNPRSPSNQKGMVVWSSTKKGVKTWVKRWGTKKQKEKFLE